MASLIGGAPNRTELFNLVRDTVWGRRIVYFVSLVFVVIAVAFPPLAQYLRIEDVTEPLNDTAGAFVRLTVGFITGFLLGFAEPWVAAVVRYPAQAAIVLIPLLASLGLSLFLQRRIRDRARRVERAEAGGRGLRSIVWHNALLHCLCNCGTDA